MCDTYDGQAANRPPHPTDISYLVEMYGPAYAELITSIVGAMTRKLYPTLPTVVSVIDLAIRFMKGERGNDGFGPKLHFSALVLGTLRRFQSPEMRLIHDGFTTFNMSDGNRRDLEMVLQPYDMSLVVMCCCGDGIVNRSKVAEFLESAAYRDENKLRTLADSFGNIVDVGSVKAIPIEILPLQEQQGFERIIRTCNYVVNKNDIRPSVFLDEYFDPTIGMHIDAMARH
jgi:hypothetical protein